MALSSLTSLQIILVVVLSLNFFIWIAFIFWRILFFGGVGNASRRYVRGLRALFRMSPSPESPAPNGSSTSRNGVESGQEVDEPPPYEEAVKYPSISSLLTINTEIGSPIFNDLVSEGSEGRQQVTTSTAMTSTSSTSQDANLTSEAAFTSARQTTTSAFSPHPISQSVQSSDTQRHHLSPTRSLSCGHIHSSSNHPHSSSHHHHSSSRHDDDDDRNPETDVNSPKSATSNQM